MKIKLFFVFLYQNRLRLCKGFWLQTTDLKEEQLFARQKEHLDFGEYRLQVYWPMMDLYKL